MNVIREWLLRRKLGSPEAGTCLNTNLWNRWLRPLHVSSTNQPGPCPARIPVAAEDARALCLSDGQLATLHDPGRRCEAAFGTAQDVEWAFAGTILVLLQSRPITR